MCVLYALGKRGSRSILEAQRAGETDWKYNAKDFIYSFQDRHSLLPSFLSCPSNDTRSRHVPAGLRSVLLVLVNTVHTRLAVTVTRVRLSLGFHSSSILSASNSLDL